MERDVRLGSVLAWLAWGAALGLTLCGTIVGLEGKVTVSLALLAHAMLAMGAGVCMSMRLMLERYGVRVQDAFMVGQEMATVRQMH